MLGEEIHHRSLKVVFWKRFCAITAAGTWMFEQFRGEIGEYHSDTGTLTRDWLFSLLKCESEVWLCKTEWNSDWKGEGSSHEWSVKCLVRRLHSARNIGRLKRKLKCLEEIHKGHQTRIKKGLGKHLKLVWGWRSLWNIWGFFCLFVFWDSTEWKLCHTIKEEELEQREQKGEKTQWVT